MKYLVGILSLFALVACDPAVPDSGRGVGFDSYDAYEEQRRAREARLAGTLPAPDPRVEAVTIIDGQAVAQRTESQTGSNVAGAGLSATPTPAPTSGDVRISDEQSFDAVAGRETIESDAERIARNREQYQVIQPTALPSRDANSGPNVVQYALSTTNAVGERLYRRSVFSTDNKFLRNCARYASADLAQQDFLARGGPQKDPQGLDPDGDGFACGWNPATYRLVSN